MILTKIENLKINATGYPFEKTFFDTLNFKSTVTFITGDNGSGKSTLLKIIQELCDLRMISSKRDFSADVANQVHNNYKLTFNHKTKRGFYLQSEDFIRYLDWADDQQDYYHQEVVALEQSDRNKQELGYLLEKNLHESNKKAMEGIASQYTHVSHGEGYLNFFTKQLDKNSLYLLDEPETPLSFESELALIKTISDAIKDGSQFIICTHSPILLAFPLADIIHLTENHTLEHLSYHNHPIVLNMKSFMDDPERYMHYLLKE